MVAALSAAHLAALLLPPSLRRLYIAVDNDPAGRRAATRLTTRARASDIEAHLLVPRGDDWNADLQIYPLCDRPRVPLCPNSRPRCRTLCAAPLILRMIFGRAARTPPPSPRQRC